MLHRIPIESLAVSERAMARAVETCVHCGFCLPSCPTYRVLGEEMDSPRGRIVPDEAGARGRSYAGRRASVHRSLPRLSRMRDVLSIGRPLSRSADPVSRADRAERAVRYREMGHAGAVAPDGVAAVVPACRDERSAGAPRRGAGAGSLRPMLRLLPASLATARPLPRLTPAVGVRRARVALLRGCVQQVLSPDIGHATLRVLAANGIEVVVPPDQGCCGALAAHAGHADHARARAGQLLHAFPDDVDAIVTNAAGCGSAMKDYGALFAGTPHEADAQRFAARVRDVSEFLDAVGFVSPPVLPAPAVVAYHDACHLSHAQRVRAAPRRLLSAVGNLTLREIVDGEICCGSAGLYNLEQPEIAEKLGIAKAGAVSATGADTLVAGNVGCLVQIAAHLPQPLARSPCCTQCTARSGPLGVG